MQFEQFIREQINKLNESLPDYKTITFKYELEKITPCAENPKEEENT